jgi:hypothetical protein
MFDKLLKLDRKHLILLGVILAAAGIYVYLAREGFSTYTNYLKYMQDKYKTTTLCDPCYDPNCKTTYPVSQADCSNSPKVDAPKYNPNDFSSYFARGATTNSKGGSDVSGDGGGGNSSSLYEQLKQEILRLIPKRQPSSDILITFAPTGGSDAKPISSDVGAPTSNVVAGAAGKLPMDKLPSPAIPPASTTACPNSPALMQGSDYTEACPYNMNDYIRKDSIPCYSCNLR